MMAREVIMGAMPNNLVGEPDHPAVLEARRVQASAILAALDAAGLAVVPKEPSEEMLYAQPGTCTSHPPAYRQALWRAMLAAAADAARD